MFVGLTHPLYCSGPGQTPIEFHAKPAAWSNIGWNKVVLWFHFRVQLLSALGAMQPQGDMAVTMVVDVEGCEDFSADSKIDHAVREPLLCGGEGQTEISHAILNASRHVSCPVDW